VGFALPAELLLPRCALTAPFHPYLTLRQGGIAMAPLLEFFSSLNAAMTHYGTGSAPVFLGAGYVAQGTWWRASARCFR